MSTPDDTQPQQTPCDKYSVPQANRIYFLPNLMTAGNLFCGFLAVIRCIQAYYEMRHVGTTSLTPVAIGLFRDAVWLIIGAMIFDSLDGRLARMRGRESLFGAEFDSIADIVSFGMAPALMVFILILSPTQGYPVFRLIGWLFGFIYLLCAAIRLARFNVITHPLITRPKGFDTKNFLGLPVPAAAVTVASIVLFLLKLAENDRTLQRWLLIPLPFFLLLIAILMVSTITYPSGKQITIHTKTGVSTFVLLLTAIVAIVAFKEEGILAICFGYIFYGIILSIKKKVSKPQPPTPPPEKPCEKPAE